MSTRDDELVGEVEEELDSGDKYILSSPTELPFIMELVAEGKDMDGLGNLNFTRKELEGFIEQCKVYLTNPDY
jgi:hypothetical protein